MRYPNGIMPGSARMVRSGDEMGKMQALHDQLSGVAPKRNFLPLARKRTGSVPNKNLGFYGQAKDIKKAR